MISIVIPVFNNGAAMVRECHRALAGVLAAIPEAAEIIFVDDGSRDDSLEALKAVQREDPRVRVLEFAANFWQHAAFSAGFEAVRGDVVVTMDVDLQADPIDIPRMIAPLRQGHDLVSGVRMNRRDPFRRRVASRVVTSLVASMTGVRLRDVGCPFNAFTGEVAKSLSTFGELWRFLKPLAVRVARSVAEVEVTHRQRPRQHVRTSYSSTRLLRLFMDFFVNSVTDIFAWVFVAAAAASIVGAVAAIAATLGWLSGRVNGSVVLVSLGFLLTSALGALLGLAGDYVQRIYRQSSGRPFYLIRRVYETGFLEVPAKLIIEVLSDDTSWHEMEQEIGECHAAGVDLVWVLDPRTLTLRAYARGASPVLLHERDTASADPHVPGFSCRVAEFFAD